MNDRFDYAGNEIFMSLGLLNELSAIVGSNPENIAIMDFDPEAQENVIQACLAKRTKLGRKVEDINLDTIDANITQTEELLDWVKGHVIDFFIRRLSKTKSLIEDRKPAMAALEVFMSGSQVSPSPT